MKKILLTLLIVILPYQSVQAFPNEPSGVLGLTYESSIDDLIELFPNAKKGEIHSDGYGGKLADGAYSIFGNFLLIAGILGFTFTAAIFFYRIFSGELFSKK